MSKNIETPFQPVNSSSNNEWAIEIARKGIVETIDNFEYARFVNTKRDFDFLLAQSEDGNFVSVRRRGGGGAVTALYTVDDTGQLWLGGVMQRRANVSDQPVFNLMRGYNLPAESNQSAALREALEESGRTDLLTPILLQGQTLNVDSAMNDSVHGGGVDLFRAEVPFEALIRNDDGTLSFDITDLTDEQRNEGIYKVLFIKGDLATVARLADSFTIVGFARLLADLDEEAGVIDYWSDPIRPPYSVD